jgi:hypothetical protein
MSQESNQACEKQTYDPPKLAAINLRPEEAVLGHCKISGGSGPTNSFGACDFHILGCHSLGS